MREMFSSISVPPRSLTPQRSASVAALEAHLHPARLQVRDRPAERQAEGGGVLEVLGSSEISSIPWVRPSIVLKGMKLSGTNSVMPPVRSCRARTTPHVAGELARLLDVAEHHRRGRAQAGRGGRLR